MERGLPLGLDLGRDGRQRQLDGRLGRFLLLGGFLLRLGLGDIGRLGLGFRSSFLGSCASESPSIKDSVSAVMAKRRTGESPLYRCWKRNRDPPTLGRVVTSVTAKAARCQPHPPSPRSIARLVDGEGSLTGRNGRFR